MDFNVFHQEIRETDPILLWSLVRNQIAGSVSTWEFLCDKARNVTSASVPEISPKYLKIQRVQALLESIENLIADVENLVNDCFERGTDLDIKPDLVLSTLFARIWDKPCYGLRLKEDFPPKYNAMFSCNSQPFSPLQDQAVEEKAEDVKEEVEEDLKCELRAEVPKRKKKLKKLEVPLECSACQKEFEFKAHYRYHIKEKSACSGVPEPKLKILDKVYYCVHRNCSLDPIPKFGFKNKDRYFKHVLECHASLGECVFNCKHCDQKFPLKELLDRHTRTKHEMKFCCTTCGKGFALRSRLTRHEQCHRWEKSFPCDLCSYRANTKEALQCHRKRHDPGERKHICGSCGKGFFTPGTLKEHEITHSDIKRFTCDICGRQLRNDSCVRKHMINVRGVKHTCEHCGKNFSSPLGMQLHQREAHGIAF